MGCYGSDYYSIDEYRKYCEKLVKMKTEFNIQVNESYQTVDWWQSYLYPLTRHINFTNFDCKAVQAVCKLQHALYVQYSCDPMPLKLGYGEEEMDINEYASFFSTVLLSGNVGEMIHQEEEELYSAMKQQLDHFRLNFNRSGVFQTIILDVYRVFQLLLHLAGIADGRDDMVHQIDNFIDEDHFILFYEGPPRLKEKFGYVTYNMYIEAKKRNEKGRLSL